MFIHPELQLTQFYQRQQELIAEAEQDRLLAAARRLRRRRGADAESDPAARGRPAGTLAGCGPRAAAPARS
jgi:hypothetical protein